MGLAWAGLAGRPANLVKRSKDGPRYAWPPVDPARGISPQSVRFCALKRQRCIFGPGGRREAPQKATQEAPVGQRPEEAHQAPRTVQGPPQAQRTLPRRPPEIPSRPVPSQHAHEAPRRGPRRPPKSPAGDHPGGRHKLPGKLQRALTGPQDTTQESPPKDTAGQCLLGLRLSVHEIGTKSTAPEGIKKRYSTTCVWCIGCSQNTYEPNHNKISTQ